MSSKKLYIYLFTVLIALPIVWGNRIFGFTGYRCSDQLGTIPKELIIIDQTLIPDFDFVTASVQYDFVSLLQPCAIDLMEAIYANVDKYSKFHIVTHGNDGKVFVNNEDINLLNVLRSSDRCSHSFNGDIAFYACNLASNSSGIALLAHFSQVFPNASIHASDNLTGNIVGSDSVFEYSSNGSFFEGSIIPYFMGESLQCNIEYMAGCNYVVNKVSPPDLVGALLEGTNYSNLIDQDLNNFVTINTAASVAGSTLASVKRIDGFFPSGVRAGFVIEPTNSSLLNADLLTGLQIRTYLGGTLQQSVNVTSGGGNGLLSVRLLSSSTPGRRRIEITTNQPFDEIELRLNTVLFALNSIRIYYAFAGSSTCNIDGVEPINANNGFTSASINNTLTGPNTLLCLLGCTTNTTNVISNNLNAAGSITTVLSLGNPISIGVNIGETIPAGSDAGFVIGTASTLGLLDLSLLGNIRLRTYLNGTLRENVLMDASVANVGLLPGNDRLSLSFNTTLSFNQIQITLNSGVSLLTSTDVFYAFVRRDEDGDGFSNPIDQCPGGDDALLNSFGQPEFCNPTCSVFAGYDVNVSSFNNSSVQLNGAAPGQSWASSPSNPSLATIDPTSGFVQGLSVEGAYTFILSDGICQDEVVVNYVRGFGDPACNIPLTNPDVVIGSSFSGACVLCGTQDAQNVISGDLNAFAQYNSLLSLLNFTTLIAVHDTSTIYPAGTRTGFELSFTDALLNADLLASFRITTYLNGVVQQSIVSSGGLVTANAVSGNGGRFRLSFVTSSDFDEVALEFSNLLSLSLGNSLRIYYAFTEPASCQNGVNPAEDPESACIEVLTSCASNNPSISYARTGFAGVACVTCGIDNLSNLLDPDPTNFATINLGVGLLVSGSISVKVDQPYPPGYEAGYLINATPELLGLDVLNNITVSTYLNGVLQESINGGSGLLNLSLITASSQSLIGFLTTTAFDEIRLTVNSPVSANLLSNLQVFYPYVRLDSDGDGIPDCLDKCLSGNDNIDQNGNGIPDACELLVVANNDNLGPIIGRSGGVLSGNVLSNDFIDGMNATTSLVEVSTVSSSPFLVLNNNGTIEVLPATPSGVYVLEYQICEIASPTNCDRAIVNVTVISAPIVANPLFLGPVDGDVGANSLANVLANDLIDGTPVALSDINFTILRDVPQIDFNLDGTIDVPPGTPQGFYTLEYQICEQLNPTNCSSALVTISVTTNQEPCSIEYLAGCEYTVDRISSPDIVGVLLEGTSYSNLIDLDLNNFVTVNTAISVAGATLASVKKINSSVAGGRKAGFVIEAVGSGLLDLSLLDALSIRTYLGTTLQENVTFGGGLLNLSLLGGGSVGKRRIDFLTSQNFDRIELVLVNTVSALTSLRIYYAYVEDSNCDGDCKTAISTANFPTASASTCSTILCPSFVNVNNVINPDTTLFAFRTSLALEQPFLQVNSGTSFTAGTEFGFVIGQQGLLGLLSLDVLNSITITTRNGNTVVETFNAGSNLAGISLLSSGQTVLSFKSNAPFQNIRITYNVTLSLLATNQVFYAFVRNDSDGDGVPDCIDTCPGGDDTVLNQFGLPAFCNPDCEIFAGFDITVSSRSTSTALLNAASPGQTWSASPSNPSPASITSAGVVTGLSNEGTYTFILSNGDCEDSVDIIYGSGAGRTDCNVPLVGNNTAIGTSAFSGACLLCGGSDASNVIDGDLNNFYQYSSLLSLVSSTTLISVRNQNRVYSAGTRAGYVIEITDAGLNADLLSGFRVTTFLNGVQQESNTFANGLIAVSAAELGSGKFRLFLNTSQDFDEIALNYGNTLNVSLGNNIRIYYAFTEASDCPSTVDLLSNPSDICLQTFTNCDNLDVRVNYERTGLAGVACVACSISNLDNLLDGNPSTFANMNLGAGVLVTGSVSIKTKQVFPGGFEAGYVIGSAPDILTADVLNNLSVRTYLNGNLQENATNVSGLLSVNAVAGQGNVALVSIITSLPFDEIQLQVNAPVTINLTSDLNIYYPFVRQDSDGDGIPDCLDKCFEGDDNFDANGNGIPDDCEFQVIAVDDQFGPWFSITASIVGNVLLNDQFNGEPANPAFVTPSLIDFGGILSATLSADGSLVVPAGIPQGVYILQYEICENGIPDNCDQAEIELTISGTLPDFNVATINQTISGSVATNDFVLTGTAYTSPVPNLSNPPGGMLNLFADGSYSFVGSEIGVYQYSITVCMPTLPQSCKIETLTIHVTNQFVPLNPPVANDDFAALFSGETVRAVSLANDAPGSLESQLVPSSVTILIPPSFGMAVVDPATGDILYTANSDFIGTDTLTYRVCDNQVPAQCATAHQVYLVYGLGSPNTTLATDDLFVTIANQEVIGNILINDTDPEGDVQSAVPQNLSLNGIGTLSILSDGTLSFNPSLGFSGTVEIPYTVCDDGSPVACANATIRILVLTTIIAQDDNGGPVNGTVGNLNVLNVLVNDTFNGLQATLLNVTLSTLIPDPFNVLSLNADGAIAVAPNSAGGLYSLTYQICEISNPENCDQAIVTVNVIGTPDFTPTNEIDNLTFNMAGEARDFVVNIFEINNAAQVNGSTIAFRISKLSAYTISYETESGISDVFGGTPNSNGDWIFTENASFITVTLKSGVTIPALGQKTVGFRIERRPNIPGNTEQNITTTILFNSGGEVNNTNNIVQTRITAN